MFAHLVSIVVIVAAALVTQTVICLPRRGWRAPAQSSLPGDADGDGDGDGEGDGDGNAEGNSDGDKDGDKA